MLYLCDKNKFYSRVSHKFPKYPPSHAVKQEPLVFKHMRQLPHVSLHSFPYEPNVHALKQIYVHVYSDT